MPEIKPKHSEIHLFIIWEHARVIEEKILEDIKKKFNVLKIIEVHWSKEKFAENLSRFYGTNLPPKSRKELHVGTNPFLAIIVEDKTPVHHVHTTTKGDQKVNTNLFTSKALHREWTGGGHKIHASNTPKEANHDLTLLFGKNTDDLYNYIKSSKSKAVEKWNHDVVGSNGWQSLKQLFYVLNNTLEYVVLRNYEPLPDKFYAEDHGDIDLLVSNYDDARFILNARPVFKSKKRVYNIVKIAGQQIHFDFRFIGDNYYDQKWQKNILKNRQLLTKGFFVPSDEDHFFSLLYHALIQKPSLGKDYIVRLADLSKKVTAPLKTADFQTRKALDTLDKFLLDNNYVFTQPTDKSVYFHLARIKQSMKKGLKFKRNRTVPIRNYLKQHKVPFKHYALKARKIVRRKVQKIKHG